MNNLVYGEIKILTCDKHQFGQIIKVLEGQKVEYHRYHLESKKFLVEFYGLHPETMQ